MDIFKIISSKPTFNVKFPVKVFSGVLDLFYSVSPFKCSLAFIPFTFVIVSFFQFDCILMSFLTVFSILNCSFLFVVIASYVKHFEEHFMWRRCYINNVIIIFVGKCFTNYQNWFNQFFLLTVNVL